MLMMYYTTVSGWMLSYFVKFLTGTFSGLNGDAVSGVFGQMLASPGEMGGYMALTVVLGLRHLQLWPAKRRGAHHQGDDVRADCAHRRVGRA